VCVFVCLFQVISDASARRGVGVSEEGSIQTGSTVQEVHPGLLNAMLPLKLFIICPHCVAGFQKLIWNTRGLENEGRGILLSKGKFASFFQGVTLTDLQEAEKKIGRSRPPKTQEEEEKEKQDKEKQEEKKETETKEDDYRSKYRSFEEVPFSSL